ncbi:hypothetical protein Tco_0610506 [Tanacetum coccineum]
MANFKVLDELKDVSGSTELHKAMRFWRISKHSVLMFELEAIGAGGVRGDCLDYLKETHARETNRHVALTNILIKSRAGIHEKEAHPLFGSLNDNNKGVQTDATFCLGQMVEMAVDNPLVIVSLKMYGRICKHLTNAVFFAKAALLQVVSTLSGLFKHLNNAGFLANTDLLEGVSSLSQGGLGSLSVHSCLLNYTQKKGNNGMVSKVWSIIEDSRLARETNKVYGEVANVVEKRKDREKVAKLKILGKEMELSARDKDLFIQKPKGVIMYRGSWYHAAFGS